MSARSNMTMRADVERNGTAATNRWGTPDVPDFGEVAANVPCRVWSQDRRDADDAGKAIVVEDLRGHVSASAVAAGLVQEGDQLVNVRDRSGLVQFTGPLQVERMQRKGGASTPPSHYLLLLRRHGGS